MKKIENTVVISGYAAKDAEVRTFTNTSVARFPLSVSRQEKNGEETKRVSALLNIETWRKNENVESFNILKKGALLTLEAYLKPETWTDKDGVSHSRVILVATKFYLAQEIEKTPKKTKEQTTSASKEG